MMKKLILVFVAFMMMCFSVPAIAETPSIPEGLTAIPGGAYVYNDKGLFIIHTYEQLTKDKSSVYNSLNIKTISNLTKKAQELSERLLKINDVRVVQITARQVDIQKFPLVESYKPMIPEITKAFQSVFGDVPTKK